MKRSNIFTKITALLISIVIVGCTLPEVKLKADNNISNALVSMAFVIDNSLAMYDYDCGEDSGWLDAYAGMMEQLPDNSDFTIVTQHGTSPLISHAEAKQAMYDIPLYKGIVDPVILLNSSEVALSSSFGRKIIVLSTASCYNNKELENKINVMSSQGIEIYVIAFEKDEQKAAEIKNTYEKVVICRDVHELPILLGDWYAELTTIQTNTQNLLSSEEDITYKSAFRESKHKYSFSQDWLGLTYRARHGVILSELLNMYYFLPTWVDGEYKIDIAYICKAIAKGNAAEMYTSAEYVKASPLIDFWGYQAQLLLESEYTIVSPKGISEEMLGAIEENLKRRMPVMISMGDYAYLITAYHKTNQTFDMIDANGNWYENRSTRNYNSQQNVRLVDTAKYFNLLRSGTYISDSQKSGSTGKEVSIKLPNGYKNGRAEDYVQCLKTTLASPDVTPIGFSNQTVRYWTQANVEFVIGVKVKIDGITPNCYNATRNYIIKIYPDVDDDDWYSDYVFDLTNRGYIIGGENNGQFGFWPNDNITIAEFLIIMFRAADIAGFDMSLPNNEERERVANYARDQHWIRSGSGLVEENQWRQVQLGLGLFPNSDKKPRPIRREEAADILWRMFTSPECRTPHQLVEYDLEDTKYLDEEWKSYSDIDSFTTTGLEPTFKDSFHQLFLNGIFAGYSDMTFLPKGNMTRAEACKIVSKALYSLAEIGTTLDPIWDEDSVETLKLGVQSSGKLSPYGGKNFRITISEPGYYSITGSDLKFHLTDYAGNVIPMTNTEEREYRITSTSDLPMRLYVAGESNAPYSICFYKKEDGYVGSSLLEFHKSAESNYIYVNNPEYITGYDIVDDPRSVRNLKFIEQTASGKNTFYETHVAWWGNEPALYEPTQSFYMDVDFYNPSDETITVSVRNLAYGTNYEVLQSYYNGGIDRDIAIKPKEHILLFEYLNAPLLSEYPGTYEGVKDDEWYGRLRKQAILFDFEISEGDSVVVSSLAAYDRDNLRLKKGLNNYLESGYLINSGDVIFDFNARANESDLANKYKGIAEHQSAWIDANLDYIIDDTVEAGNSLKVQPKDPYYSEVAGPYDYWMTHLNGFNDDFGAHKVVMPESIHRYTYHHSDTDRKWQFAFDYRDTRTYTEEGNSFDPLNAPIPDTVINKVKSDVATGQNSFSSKPDAYSIGISSWGATYHYTITVRNVGNKDRLLNFQVQNYNNMIFGYKAQGALDYTTQFDEDAGDDWWIPVSVPIPGNSTITFEVVTLLGGGHGGTTYKLILNDA